jgi:hypothetical protein
MHKKIYAVPSLSHAAKVLPPTLIELRTGSDASEQAVARRTRQVDNLDMAGHGLQTSCSPPRCEVADTNETGS